MTKTPILNYDKLAVFAKGDTSFGGDIYRTNRTSSVGFIAETRRLVWSLRPTLAGIGTQSVQRRGQSVSMSAGRDEHRLRLRTHSM